MKFVERFAELINCSTLDAWQHKIFTLASDLGYEQTLLAILPNRHTPIESAFAFLHSNYSPAWRGKYDEQKFEHVDPTVAHIVGNSTPLIWEPRIFATHKQQEMYEEASSFGIRSGVTLPIHGYGGELGMLCFVSDCSPGKAFQRHVSANLPQLSCFRDFIFDSSVRFMRSPHQETLVHVTNRELECLKWAAVGKSSWEIGQILNCSEATVNFHFGNIRRKLNSKSRQQAMVKAIRLGLISPP